MAAVPLQLLTFLAETRGDGLGWQDDALCAQTDPSAFYPAMGVPPTAAKLICARCDVRLQCQEAALRTDALWGEWGVWGGLSASQRRRERRRRERSAA